MVSTFLEKCKNKTKKQHEEEKEEGGGRGGEEGDSETICHPQN